MSMSASGLDVTKEEIEKVRVEIDVALKSIDGFDVKLRLKKEELGKLKEDYKQLMALDKYADEIQEYLAKIYWRDVLEADQALEELNTTLAARKSERDGSEELLLTAQQAHASLLDVDSLGDRMEEIQRALSELGPELEVKTIALSTARRRLNGLDASYKEVMRGKADMIRDLEDVKKRVFQP
jgi:chromosome segregation ATPase